MTGHTTVLVTGMSGVGKSTALTELARRGYVTVDTDEGPWIQVFEGEPLWRGFRAYRRTPLHRSRSTNSGGASQIRHVREQRPKSSRMARRNPRRGQGFSPDASVAAEPFA